MCEWSQIEFSIEVGGAEKKDLLLKWCRLEARKREEEKGDSKKERMKNMGKNRHG